SVVLYGPGLLDARPDVGRRFMTAYLRGVRQYALGKTAHNIDLIVRPLGLDRDALARACWPSVSPDGTVAVASLLEFQQWSVATHLVDRAISSNELLDLQFLQYANKALAGRGR